MEDRKRRLHADASTSVPHLRPSVSQVTKQNTVAIDHSYPQTDRSPAATCSARPRRHNRAMPPHNVAALVHLVGFLTGAALYGMLFALVLRRPAGHDRLPLGTAVRG